MDPDQYGPVPGRCRKGYKKNKITNFKVWDDYNKNFYKNIDFNLSDFFSYRLLKKNNLNKKFKIITTLSMFYDLKKPIFFVKDIKKILHKDGIFILEHADLLSIIKNCLFDTICHEHLEYYSSKIIINLMKKNKQEGI